MCRKHWMFESHPWPCKSHSLSYLRPHVGLEAVNFAFGTNGLIDPEHAFYYLVLGIIGQLFTPFAKFISAMVMFAEHLYHFANSLNFSFQISPHK
jgi:hypothetical protein